MKTLAILTKLNIKLKIKQNSLMLNFSELKEKKQRKIQFVFY